MDLSTLLASLARPSAYPAPPASIEVRHTHISAVYLADGLVYKVKKPVDFGFLNFLTLADRKFYCEAEVRLNSRLAPGVYLGVVPVTLGPEGPRFGGEGEAIEWAVKMRRLPDDATLAARLARAAVTADTFRDLARRIAAFHASVDRGPEIARHGSFETIAHNSRENFEQSQQHIGLTLTRRVWERLVAANERLLAANRELMEKRAASGMTRDVHGDLHLDHVYLFPEKTPPDDVAVLDCVEFNDSYRCSDTVADTAFLCMDLIFHGRADLAQVFADAYFDASGDGEGRALLPFYIGYRAAVRGKVEGLLANAPEAPQAVRDEVAKKGRRHWLVALGALEEPGNRPALLITMGLPGSGKSRIAADLGTSLGFTRIVADVVRKELAGLAPTESGRAEFGEGIYTPEWNDRTYGECMRRAREILLDGGRVVVDASFREASRRREFVVLAAELGVPVLFIHRTAPDEVVFERLSRRGSHSISDADWEVSKRAAAAWQETPELAGITVKIPHLKEKGAPLAIALEELARRGLC